MIRILLFVIIIIVGQVLMASPRCEFYYIDHSYQTLNLPTLNEFRFKSEQYHLHSNAAIESPAEAFLEWSIKEIARSLKMEVIKSDNLYVSAEGKKFVKFFRWNSDKEVFNDLSVAQNLEEKIFYAISYILSPESHIRLRYLQSQKGEIYKSIWRIDFDRSLWLNQHATPPQFSNSEVAIILQKMSEIPMNKIIEAAKYFDLSQAEVYQIQQRYFNLQKSLGFSDGIFNNSRQMIKAILHERKIKNTTFDPVRTAEIKQRLTTRFLKDFQQNSQFKNFEEFKNEVMSIPEYVEIVKDIFKKGKIYLRLPGTKRLGVLTHGIQNLFETRKSTFMEGRFEDNPYVKLREAVESEALGVSAEQFKTDVPNQYRAKSFFFDINEIAWNSSTVMGNDIYVLDFNKVLQLHNQGKLVFSLTLGDSGRASIGWQGRPIPIDMFPYFAAPFIFQARQETNLTDGVMAPVYRKNVFGTADNLPSFIKNLEKKFKFTISEKASMADEFNPSTLVTDYIEAQIFGQVSPDLIQQFLPDRNSAVEMSDALKDTYSKFGIRVR